jgi:hemerythrin-like metal-binding protein
VETLNELHAAMMKGQAATVTGAMLKKLLDYTRDHFSSEEYMLSTANYPGLATHRVKHRDLTKQVEDFVERYQKGEARMNLELLNFLNDWLTTHILKEDQDYSKWMLEQGKR